MRVDARTGRSSGKNQISRQLRKKLADEMTINAPKDQVYAALNDCEVLKQCIPGCEELIQKSDTELEAKVVLKFAPVKARFGGEVTLDKSGAPDAFSLSSRGSVGAMAHAKGGADVTLTADGDTTILKYVAKAQIEGKFSLLGSHLIQSTTKKLAWKFFTSFAKVMDGA